MIYLKTHSEFLKLGFDSNSTEYTDLNYCYYHHPRNKPENFDYSTIRIMVNDRYSCKMVENFLKIKYFEQTGDKLV